MKKLHAKKDPYSAYDRHPERDWTILICIMLVVTVAVLAGSAFLYDGISSGTLFVSSTEAANPAAILDSQNLHSLVGSYGARAAQFQALRSNDPKVFDPSL